MELEVVFTILTRVLIYTVQSVCNLYLSHPCNVLQRVFV